METDNEPVETAEPTVTVEVPEPDDGGEVERGEEKTPTDRPSRKERRDAKKTDFQAELRARDERFEQQRQNTEQMARELAELRGRVSERQQQTQKDPYADQISELEKAAKADLKAAAAAMEKNPEEAERLVDEHNKKLRKLAVLEFRQQQDAEQAERQRNAPQPLPPPVQDAVDRVADEFRWVRTNARARQATDALVDEWVSQGKPPTYETLRAAAAQVATAFGLGGHERPSNEQRQRYRGVGAGEGEGAGGNGKRTVEMGKHELALARALANREGKGADDEAAKKLWAERVGSRLAGRQG